MTVVECERGHRTEYPDGKHVPPFCEYLYTITNETIRCNGFGQGRSRLSYQHMCMATTRAPQPKEEGRDG